MHYLYDQKIQQTIEAYYAMFRSVKNFESLFVLAHSRHEISYAMLH